MQAGGFGRNIWHTITSIFTQYISLKMVSDEMVKTRSNHWNYEPRVMGWSHKSIMLGEELLNAIIPLLNPDMDHPNNDS